VVDELSTIIADAFNNHEPRDGSDDSDNLTMPPHICDQDVEIHHHLYLKRDGVLEAPFNNMANTHGRLNSERVCNFSKPLTYFTSIFPIVHWKLISRETSDNAKERLAM
jgi:hypothetical protein